MRSTCLATFRPAPYLQIGHDGEARAIVAESKTRCPIHLATKCIRAGDFECVLSKWEPPGQTVRLPPSCTH